jgi:hypothetical protein
MPPSFPCPNPACTHTFSPQAVKGASSLICPRCGTVFQFVANAPASSRPSRTMKPPAVSRPSVPPPLPKPPPPRPVAPVANVPVAQPVSAKDVPIAAPVGALPAHAALNFNSTPDVVVPHTRRLSGKGGKRRLAPLLAILVLVVLGLGLAVWGGLWLIHFKRMENAEEDPVHAASLFNCRFILPDKPWKRDRDIELHLHVNLGMRSSQSNNCMGLYFKDYKTRVPSDAEMVDEALDKLRSYFQGLAWELKPKAENVQFGGHPALALEFQGDDPESVQMNGECHMLAYRGYAYWFFTWVPLRDKELLSPEWADLRRQFTLLDGRKGWTEKPRETEPVQGKKAKYQLAYVKGLWTPKPAEDYDDLADLVLQGDEPDPGRRKHSSKSATFQVLVLPKQDNLKIAAAAAREYLRKREEKEYPKTTFETNKDKRGAEMDRNTDIGKEHGHLSKFRVRNTEDLERFLIVAVVNRPDGVLVLVGDCLWDRRDFWDQEFTPLLDTLKVR